MTAYTGVLSTDALTSGVRFLALVVPQIVTIIFSGGIVSKCGHYVPFMVAGTILAVVGTGLIIRINPNTSSAALSSFLAITGVGLELGMQQPYTAVTLVLGAIAVPIGQTIFLNVITAEAPVRTPTITPQTIIETGSTRLRSLASNDQVLLAALRMLYSVAVTRTLILALATAAAALPFAVCMEWKKTARKPPVEEEEGEEANQDSDRAVEEAPDGMELVCTELKPNVDISAQS
ncbi:MAG: hypothetical protein Q9193_001247 [Seirophora villosa]